MGLLLIARFTLQEAIRRRLFLAILLLSLLIIGVFATLFGVVISQVGGTNSQGIDPQLFLLGIGVFLDVAAIWLVYLLSSLFTIVMTAGMISSEVDAGTFAVIVPKPLARAEIVLGKWSGYALVLCVYTACLLLAFLTVVYWLTGYWPEQAPGALGMLELGVLALLALTTLGSACVPTIVNGAIALVLFVGAPIASFAQFIVQFISPTQLHSVQNITTVINLVIPTDALWHATSFYLLPPAAAFASMGQSTDGLNTPFTSAQPVAWPLVVWVVLYCCVLPVIAALRFQRRDL
jgi:ABC-type transport system involved in multi-copper enzyme maturation permease subunit